MQLLGERTVFFVPFFVVLKASGFWIRNKSETSLVSGSNIRGMSREILDCLKRERDICVKNVIHSQNTAFMFTPALISTMLLTRCCPMVLRRYVFNRGATHWMIALLNTLVQCSTLQCGPKETKKLKYVYQLMIYYWWEARHVLGNCCLV